MNVIPADQGCFDPEFLTLPMDSEEQGLGCVFDLIRP